MLSRLPHQQEDLAPEAQESLDFLASLGSDEVAPTGYQTVDNAHDNQIENKASELEEEHEDGQDAELEASWFSFRLFDAQRLSA